MSSLWRDLAADQAFLVGGCLLVSGIAKLAPRSLDTGRNTLLLRRLSRTPRSQAALWLALGSLEASCGLASCLGLRLASVASFGLLAAAAGYLPLSRARAPAAPCGCLGARSTGAPSVPTQARVILLALAAAAAAAAAAARSPEVKAGPLVGVAIEFALIGALSPELRFHAKARGLVRRVRCAAHSESEERSLLRIQSSPLWPAATDYLSSEEPIESWKDGCSLLMTFAAAFQDRPVTAVFGVPVASAPGHHRLAIVDEGDQAILHQTAVLVGFGDRWAQPLPP